MSWRLRPPRLLFAVVAVWSTAVVVTFSDAGVPFPTWILLSVFGLGLAALCFTRLLILRLHDQKERRDGIRENSRWWLLTFGLLMAGLLFAATSSLLSIRVYLSNTALRESAGELSQVSAPDLYEQGRWVGLFHVKEFSKYGSELRFITNECGLIDTCGVVYSPDGPPQHRGEDSFSHLFGPWWHWYQSF